LKLSKNIDRVMVITTQVPESPRSLSIIVDLKSPLNGAPHWMTETLAGSALMKKASNCSKTLQEYRSGYENLVGEVPGSDIKQISLDLSFTKSQDVPYGSQTSQSTDKCRMMITLQKIPQTDGPTPTNKTQLSEWPWALRISWIEPPSINWL
jgi:hypothetical protein